MAEDYRWILGLSLTALLAVLSGIVGFQGQIDAAQDTSIVQSRDESQRTDQRHDQVLEKIVVTQAEISASLAAVARTLEQIDEKGTSAWLTTPDR